MLTGSIRPFPEISGTLKVTLVNESSLPGSENKLDQSIMW